MSHPPDMAVPAHISNLDAVIFGRPQVVFIGEWSTYISHQEVRPVIIPIASGLYRRGSPSCHLGFCITSNIISTLSKEEQIVILGTHSSLKRWMSNQNSA